MERSLIMALNSDQVFLDLIREFLGEEGYAVQTWLENATVFAEILNHKPHLVILELLITDPESAFLVLNKMRIHPETVGIPVIIVTTTTQLIRDNEAHLRSKGCDILQKPFELEELITMVSKYVPPGAPERS